MNLRQLFSLPAGSTDNASKSYVEIPTNGCDGVIFDANVTAFSGGTTPSIQFYVQRKGLDGVWYTVWTGTALTAAGASSQTIGAGCETNKALGHSFRFGYTITGSPTSITFSVSIQGF